MDENKMFEGSTLNPARRGVARLEVRHSRRLILTLLMGLVIGAAIAVLPTRAGAATEAPENPKAYLGPTPDNLSKAWIKRFIKISRKQIRVRVKVNGEPSVPPVYRIKGCYANMYQQLMRMRKPALSGSNYGYWGDFGGVYGGFRGWGYMVKLARVSTGAYFYGFTKVRQTAKRKKLKRKMRKQALYWAKRGLQIWKEGERTNFSYIPEESVYHHIAIGDVYSLVNIPDVIRRPNFVPPSIVGVYPQPKSCRK